MDKSKPSPEKNEQQQEPEIQPGTQAATASTLRIAIAQICRAAGYTGAQPSALLSLTDIAGKYLETLGYSAASSAAFAGRSQSNLADVAFALEELALPRWGFKRAWDPRFSSSSLFKSSPVIEDLAEFVWRIREEPFAKPLPKKKKDKESRDEINDLSFKERGITPASHMPEWLPCFPEMTVEARVEEREEAVAAAVVEEEERENGEERWEWLPAAEEREKVKFKLMERENSSSRISTQRGKKNSSNKRFRDLNLIS